MTSTISLITGTLAFLTWITAAAAITGVMSGDSNLLFKLSQYAGMLSWIG